MKKKHIIHSAALLLGLCLAGCKESLPDNFGAIEGIYFYNQLTDRTVVDSAAYTFIYEDADVLEVPVRLQLVGRAAAQPRAVDVGSLRRTPRRERTTRSAAKPCFQQAASRSTTWSPSNAPTF